MCMHTIQELYKLDETYNLSDLSKLASGHVPFQTMCIGMSRQRQLGCCVLCVGEYS